MLYTPSSPGSTKKHNLSVQSLPTCLMPFSLSLFLLLPAYLRSSPLVLRRAPNVRRMMRSQAPKKINIYHFSKGKKIFCKNFPTLLRKFSKIFFSKQKTGRQIHLPADGALREQIPWHEVLPLAIFTSSPISSTPTVGERLTVSLPLSSHTHTLCLFRSFFHSLVRKFSP